MRETRTYGLMRGCWLARVTHGAPGSTPPNRVDRPEACGCGPWERRDAGDRRETAWKGRVQASSRSWPVLYTPPGHAVSRAVDPGTRPQVFGRDSMI
jgi:hypothetical protein